MSVAAAAGDLAATSSAAGPVADAPQATGIATPPPTSPTQGDTGIPPVVLAAYRAAAGVLATTDPSCRLPWTLLAAVGKVESGHAGGGRVDGTGTTEGTIIGPRLDGGPGVAAIHDTDGGALDGDVVWDRAVGPMQLIPRTWKIHAVDGNGDGVASPNNVFDAALAAGRYLCAGGGDLSRPAVERAALMRYNRSAAYGAMVLAWADAYLGGDGALPSRPGSVPAAPKPPRRMPAPGAAEPPGAVQQRAPAQGGVAPAAPVVIAAESTPAPAQPVTGREPARPVVTQPAPSRQPARSTPAPVRTAVSAATTAPPASGTARTTAAPIVTTKADGT